jgi:hypothetical protein
MAATVSGLSTFQQRWLLRGCMKEILFYQPVKFVANLFGIKLTASYHSTLPPPPVHLDIPFDKDDKNIFNNLPHKIIKDYASKVHAVHNDTIHEVGGAGLFFR